MQQTIGGQFTVTGTLKDQLTEVYQNSKAVTAKELTKEWFFIKYGLDISEKMIDELLSADRIARQVIKL